MLAPREMGSAPFVRGAVLGWIITRSPRISLMGINATHWFVVPTCKIKNRCAGRPPQWEPFDWPQLHPSNVRDSCRLRSRMAVLAAAAHKMRRIVLGNGVMLSDMSLEAAEAQVGTTRACVELLVENGRWQVDHRPTLCSSSAMYRMIDGDRSEGRYLHPWNGMPAMRRAG